MLVGDAGLGTKVETEPPVGHTVDTWSGLRFLAPLSGKTTAAYSVARLTGYEEPVRLRHKST